MKSILNKAPAKAVGPELLSFIAANSSLPTMSDDGDSWDDGTSVAETSQSADGEILPILRTMHQH